MIGGRLPSGSDDEKTRWCSRDCRRLADGLPNHSTACSAQGNAFARRAPGGNHINPGCEGYPSWWNRVSQAAGKQAVSSAGSCQLKRGRVFLDQPYQLLAEVLTPEQADKRVGCIFKAINDGFAILDFAFSHPLVDLLQCVPVPVDKVEDEKTLNAGPFDDQVPQQPWALGRSVGVVLVDLATDDDPRRLVDLRKSRVGKRSAHVIEKYIDSSGTAFVQFCC